NLRKLSDWPTLARRRVQARSPATRDQYRIGRFVSFRHSANNMIRMAIRKIQDVHVIATLPLVAPHLLKDELPVDERVVETVVKARDTIRRILKGDDRRMLCVVGPCSIHDPEAALDYAGRLAELGSSLAGQLFITMRVYFEKPRTTIGWKGLINDPHMDDSCDMETGLRIARR